MLIDFSITNYRSLKGKTTLSLIADGFDSKSENINVYDLTNGKQIRLLNTALVFGSNGSGKSNIVRALFDLFSMIKYPEHEGESLSFYDPFKFDFSSKDKPTKYEISFLDEEGTPYFYSVSFNKNEIIAEKLMFWPNGRETEAFTREIRDENSKVHYIKIGRAAQEKNTEEKIYKNNFALSHFSSLTPNEVILKAFNGLKRIRVFNSLNDSHRRRNSDELGKLLVTDESFRNRVNALIRFADLNINGVLAEERPDSKERRKGDKYRFKTIHQLFDGETETIHEVDFPLEEESQGSQTVLGLGTEIIHTLDEGGALLVDEFETSLHPKLSQALIRVFQSEKLNPKKAQLLFTTHDTNLMDHNSFRRDQIWFTEKNNRGETELYSLMDFDKLREAHVFEKWYLSGKFGALPKLETIENAFG